MSIGERERVVFAAALTRHLRKDMTMKLSTKAISGAVGVAALSVMTLGVLPGQYTVERSIDIGASPELIAAKVANLPERTSWVAWARLDPEAKYSHAGQGGVPGSSMHFEGKSIGMATVTLKAVDARRVETLIEYQRPLALSATDAFELQPLGTSTTRVRWVNTARLSFGPARIFGLVADRVMGAAYQEGLENLKAQLEKQTGHVAER